MPLTGTGTALGTAIKAAIEAKTGNALPASTLPVWQAVGEAIVAHLVANATVVVASVSAVTPGGGTSGPGAGTIT